ncbi:MAG: protein translocase subunit SecD, partial [Clostridiales bacterium]|nr:protein translocase subunit SecD [Clostridiales bacterium]
QTQYGDNKTVYIKGLDNIRWGIDIKGGVDVTFTPPATQKDVTKEQMSAAEETIKQRMTTLNITDGEVYTDYSKHRIIVRFPWKEDEEDFDPEAAVKELGETAELTFREGYETDDEGLPSGVTKENVILTGDMVTSATVGYDSEKSQYVVQLKLDSEGTKNFSEATSRLASSKGVISIWMDETVISYPTVNEAISGGEAVISGNFTVDEATSLANKITAGSLPFKLETENYNTISPTLGEGARDAMLLAMAIAFVAVCIFIIAVYRLPGVVASIGLLGQVAGSFAAVSGFFPAFSSFTLTLPGLAGIILAVGMGVDANVITTERIKEELYRGKSLDGSINTGFKAAFTAIFDGNVTMIIIAMILMGAFGPPSSIFSKMLTPLFFMFGPSTAGTIYSFGYTLMVGVILNFVMGVTCSRLMLKSLSRFKAFRNPALYGGPKNEERV